LGYLHGDSQTLRYIAVENVDGINSLHREERVEIGAVDPSKAFATMLGTEARVHAIQGAPLVDIATGDEVMIMNVASTDVPHYVLLSSALGTSPLGK
jgi:hypothetical protein